MIALFALAHSRFANIWVCTRVVNLLRHPEMHVPEKHEFMLWFSGLRGAIAFALSLQAVEDLPGVLVDRKLCVRCLVNAWGEEYK